MFIFRLLAWVLVAVALMLLGADIISTLELGVPEVRTTAEIMGLLGLSVMPFMGGGAADLANFFLEAPMWTVLGVTGIILTLVFRPID